MCGIIGFSGTVNGNFLSDGLKEILHRGPDDFGIFDSEEGIGLGHSRLSILDLSPLGHQPMVRNNIVIVFNGEIYNFKELRAELIQQGFIFNSETDTEVLINLYISDGEDMLFKLKGIFAFAILDLRSKNLFIARDAMGVKPLYYSQRPNSFTFASEIKGLLKLKNLNQKFDAESINRYLSFLWCPGEGTPLNSVKKLLPGEAIIVNEGKIKKKWQWFELPIINNNKNISKREAINGVASHLRNAVKRQMISDVPLGAFLSGGLDSSAIVAFAKDINPEIRCFTIETDGKQDMGFVDDLPYAKKVASHLNVPLDVIKINSNQMANELEFMVKQLDEPLADPAALNVFYISKLARSQGIKVLLSGAGGDDLFTGYRRHYALHLERYWSWLSKNTRGKIADISSTIKSNNHFGRRIEKMFNGAGLSKRQRLINYFRWTDDSLLASLYSEDFKQNLCGSDSNKIMEDFLDLDFSNSSSLDQMLALEQRFFLPDHNLNYTDKMSMAVGVEVRVPYLDLDLVDFSSKIPNRFMQKGSCGKWVLKKAMEPYLPKEIIYRPKTGFGVPLRRWMKFELREITNDLLSMDSITKRGFFSAKKIHNLILDDNNGKIDASYTLFSILCLEIWCRAYLDN